ncbi:ribosome maturation factor RimM [Henriciella aquimarina]|uniref:ribosome maturation factor RimM n=1 Tax=Henriciella aquimarina TaxID=545261 RepID=UPI000A06B357|nr:ribosome maturation factor RimM [Henriciella aquimarina]
MTRGSSDDRLIVVGALAGAHGVRGDVRVKSFTDEPDALFAYGPLLSETGEALLDARQVRPAKDHFIVTPKKPRQKEDWDALKGTRLHVRRSSLPPPDEDEFYVDDLTGLTVLDETGTTIGTVKAVQNFGAGDLVEVLPSQKGQPSFFVPFTLADVPALDFSAGTITLADAAGWADTSGGETSEDAEDNA